MHRQEIARAAALHAALLERDLGHVAVRKVGGQVVDPADAGAIRDGLDVEDENRGQSPISLQSWKIPVER
jgi:hypothetical protein